GKTLLGHHIKYILEQHRKINPSFKFAITAYTGSSASILSGTTIHSTFGIPLYFQPEDQEAFLQSFSVTSPKAIRLRLIKFILIDEVSFVGKRMLQLVDCILKKVSFVDKDKPFANKSIIMMGDIWQLGPVGDFELYTKPLIDSPQHLAAFNLYHSFENVFALKNSYRQGGNDESSAKHRQLLERLKRGGCQKDDIDFLSTRIKNKLSEDEIRLFRNSLHIFPTNSQVRAHNLSVLKSTYAPDEIIVIENGDEILQIAVGASVILQKNLNIEWGLVNSARGTIKKVHYKEDVAYCIVVDFPNYTGNMQEMETFGGVPIFKTFTNTYCRDTNRFIWVNKFPIG
ncbi:unnamed protein product, partial [Allacma fusca]